MITATDLEVRAGARTLLSTDGAALRVQPGDRIGLVGRNGAGKTTTMRILAGEGEPYAGTIARTGEIGYLPQDPKRGRPRRPGPRPGAVGPRPRHPAGRPGEAAGVDGRGRRRRHPRPRGAPLRPARGAVRRARRVRRRKRGGPHLRESRPARTGSDPAAAHAVRRSAPPGGAVAHPVRRVRHRVGFGDHAAARRADQPPRRRLAGLAARLPARPHRRAGGDQPQRRPARRRRQPGVVPRRRARRGRRLQHGLAEVPRRARHRRTASPPRTRQRRTQGLRAAHPGRQDGRQGHQSRCRAEHAAPRRPDDGRPRRGTGRRQGGPDQVPDARRRAAAPRWWPRA